jgi:sugar/nucleoside kinase (ribokinase family)
LRAYGLPKGKITEIPPRIMNDLRMEFTGYTIYPGGSPPNTVAGYAALGGKAAFLGKVCNDAGGRSFRNAFASTGVLFPNADHPASPDAMTATCMVLVTPDEIGTVVNCPGVSDRLTVEDIFPDVIAASRLLYLQAHMLYAGTTAAFSRGALDAAHAAKRQLAFSLHDHRMSPKQAALFRDQHKAEANIVIGNREEFESLFDAPFADFQAGAAIMVMTDGEKGAYIAGQGELHHIPPYKLGTRPNTIGAGDQFAAGFLFGYLSGLTLERCGELGAEAAAAILEIAAARPPGSWTHISAKYKADIPAALRRRYDGLQIGKPYEQ